MFRSAGEDRWLSYALALMARVRTGQERLPEAESLLEEARAVWGRVTVTYGQPFDAYLRFYLGGAALVRGDVDTTRAHFEASARQLEAAGDDTAHGAVLGGLGMLAAQRGEHAEARATFARALPLLRPGADQWDLALVLLNSGLEEAQAVSPAAAGLLTEALQAWQRLHGGAGMALALAGLGEVAAGAGQRSACRCTAAQALLPETHPLLRVTMPYDLPAGLAAARTASDPAAFDRGLTEGQGWTMERAVAVGLARAADPDAGPE